MNTKKTSPYLTPVLIGVTLILGFATYKVSVLRTDLELLQESNLKLEEELRRLSAQLNLQTSPEIESERAFASSPISSQSSSEASMETAASGTSSKFSGRTEWHTAQSIEQIEGVVALNPEQREALSLSIGAFFKAGEKRGREHEYAELLHDAMGEELYSQYEEKRIKKATQESQQKINDETIILSKKLALSSEQEAEVRKVLERVEQSMTAEQRELESKMAEAMASHFDGASGKERLKQQFEEINQISKDMKKRKDTEIFLQTADFLNDEQKNQLLELQAKE